MGTGSTVAVTMTITVGVPGCTADGTDTTRIGSVIGVVGITITGIGVVMDVGAGIDADATTVMGTTADTGVITDELSQSLV